HIFKPFTKCCPLISCTRFPSSHPIRYGQPVQFVLEPAIQSNEKEDSQRTQLFLASDLKRLGDVSSADGEQDIYFELNQPTFSSVWCLEVADPALRHEMEGTPVKLDEKLLIRHVRTNQVLALKPRTIIRNAFGPELGISVKTLLDPHKVERDVNVWLLTSINQPLIPSRLEMTTAPKSDAQSTTPNEKSNVEMMIKTADY
ncbi:hypothetical protein FBUS_00451, partial [Fasciolopsis buskii]